MEAEHSELTTVGRAYGVSEAALAAALLDAHGIEVFLDSWHTVSVQWYWAHALGGIELRVPASQAGPALEILADFQTTSRCKNRLLRLIIVSIVFFWVGFPPPPSGFFVAAVRQVPPRASTPLASPS